jgi:hypothetical protein
MKRTLATTLAAAVPLSALLWLSGAVPAPLAFGATTLIVFFVALSGTLALRALDVADLSAPAAWVAGVFMSALGVYALVAWCELPAVTAFAVWASVLVACALLFPEREPAGRLDGPALIGLALCGLLTMMWCHAIARAPAELARDGRLYAWIDYFVHGGIISQFADPLAVRGSVFLADYPPLLYHYASYMLPAALAGLLDQPGFALATSFWLPLGVLTMCAGAYALGDALAGTTGALASVAVLTLLPDASTYGLRNGFLSFHFHMVVTPGADYVIGLFFLCAALLSRWQPGASVRPVLGSAVLALGAVWFRIQVFAVGFPAWLATAALATRAVRARWRLFSSAAALAFIFFVIGFYAVTDSDFALHVFLEVVHDRQEPTAYSGLYLPLRDRDLLAIPVGILLMYVASLGAFFVLYPLAVWLAHRARALRSIDLFPALALATYLAVMLTAPIDKHRDSTEFTVRPFVLVYAAVAVWTVCLFARVLAVRWPQRVSDARRAVLAASLLMTPVLWQETFAMTLPRFDWGWGFFTKIEPGLIEAARYVRERGRPGQVFAVRGLRLKWAVTDPAVQLISLSGMPAYLSYTSAHIIEAKDRAKVALQRYAELARLDRSPSADAALAELRRLGIAWYVVTDGAGPPWDGERRRAAFIDRRVAVYAVPER